MDFISTILYQEENLKKLGIPVDTKVHDQLAKKAEEAGDRYEQVKASSERKFGEDCN